MKIKALLASMVLASSSFAQVPTSNQIVNYPYNGNANDISGNPFTTTVNNVIITSDRFGTSASAYQFNGTANIVTSNVSLNTQELSGSVWFNISAFDNTNGSRIFESDWSNSGNFSMAVLNSGGNNKLEVALRTSSGQVNLQSISSIQLNQWYHAVFSYCNGSAQLFLNNELQQSLNSLSPLTSATNSLITGGSSIWSYEGKIDDIKLYSSCLDSTDVGYLFYESPCVTQVTVYDTVFVSVTDTLFIDIQPTNVTPSTLVEIKAYPNPAHDILYISVADPSTLNGYNVVLINSLSQNVGSFIITQASHSINMTGLSAGTYFLDIYDTNSSLKQRKKVILH